jgi:hypothetical protein
MTSPKTAGVIGLAVRHPLATAGIALGGTALVKGGLQSGQDAKMVMKQIENMREDPGTPVAKIGQALDRVLAERVEDYARDASLMSKTAGINLGTNVLGSVVSGFAEGMTKFVADKIFAKPLTKAYDILDKKFYLEPKQRNVLQQAIQSDPILARAMEENPLMVTEAYKTIKQYAPSLTVDVNSLRNFLRQAVTMGGQVDFMTVKLLAEIEKTNRQARGEIGGPQ